MPFPDLHALRDFYGLLAPPPAEPYQFFLWEILSADAIPARRDLAWQALRRIPALTPDSVFRVPSKVLLDAIGLVGAHRDERLERIRAVTGEIKRHRELFDEDLLRSAGMIKATRTFRRLGELPRDTLDRALLFAASYPVLPLDDGAARVVARGEGTAIPIGEGAEGFTLKRAQWSGALRRQRRRARRVLSERLAKDLGTYKEAILYLSHHAVHTCIAVGPHCSVCPLVEGCAFGKHEIAKLNETAQ